MKAQETSSGIHATHHSPLMLILFQQKDEPQLYPGIVMDMTISSLKLITVKSIPPDTNVILHLELLESKPLTIKGIVKWGRAITTHKLHESQSPNFIQEIKFTDLSHELSKVLAEHVYSRLMMELGERDPIEVKSHYLQNRNYLRIPITLTIFCRDSQNTPFSIVTEDLSGGGTRFTTKHSLIVGEEIYLQIQLELSASVITALGKITWLRKIDQETYEGGLEFRDISVQGRTAIVEYLAKSVKQLENK